MGHPYSPEPSSPRALPFVVDLRALHRADERQLQALALLQPGALLAPLLARVREAAELAAQEGEVVRGGERMIDTRTPGEIGVQLQRGLFVGAAVALRWKSDEPLVCQVRVSASARATRIAAWASGALSLPLGFALSRTWLGQAIGDPRAKLLLAVGLALVLWLVAVVLITRTGAFSDVAACEEAASRLRQMVGRRLKGTLASATG